MCVIRAFNYIITIFHIKKDIKEIKKFKEDKPLVFLGSELTHAQIFNERDKWRQTCMTQSHNYITEIKRLNEKIKKYQAVDLS